MGTPRPTEGGEGALPRRAVMGRDIHPGLGLRVTERKGSLIHQNA